MKKKICIRLVSIALGLLLVGSVSILSYAEAPPVAEPPEAAPPEASLEETEPLLTKTLFAPKETPPIVSVLTSAGSLWEWMPQGPGPTEDGQVTIPPDDLVTGAVHTVVAHPTDPDTLYLGAVNGGVWRTTNATDPNPNWTPLTDQFPSLSIGALEFDPTDATNQTLVAGIGRYSNFGRRGGPRTGLLRTTDGGSTWVQLGDVDLAGRNISGVGPRGNIILVAVNTGTQPGMYRSTDGGANFQFISGLNGLNNGPVFDLVGDPGNQNRFYSGVGGANGGVFRTDDAGASWTNATDAAIGGLVGVGTGNIELAVHDDTAAGTNAVYVAVCNPVPNAGQQLAGILRSANQGGAWTAMDLPQTNEAGTTVGIHWGGQCGTNLSVVADPTNDQIVYVGGDVQPNPFPNSIGATDFEGRLFRGDASIAPTGAVPSPQWTALTHNGTGGGTAPHADSREMVFDANGEIIEGDDGGIYRRTSAGSTTGDWESVIGDLQVTEFHDIAYDTNSNILIGGAQDTGTPQQITTGGTTWDSVDTADGGDVAVDNITLAGSNQSIRYSSRQRLGGFRRATYNASNTLLGTVFPALTTGSGTTLVTGSLGNVQFKTPVKLNEIDPNRLVIGGGNNIWESSDQGDNLDEVVDGFGNGVGVNRPHAIAYGGRSGGVDNPDVLYVGSGNQVFIRTAAGGALNASTALPAGAGVVCDIELDPDDWRTAYVVDANQVFVTDDAGVTWTDITGNLADNNLRTVVFVPATGDIVLVGGESGVFAMRSGTPGVWAEIGTGLPEAPVYELDYDDADDVVVAGTLGRGAWLLSDVSVNVNIPPICDANGPYIQSCQGTNTAVMLDGTGSSDPDPGDALTYSWTTDCAGATFDDPTSPTPTLTVDSSPGCFVQCNVLLTVTDSAGESSNCSATVTIFDSTPPVISCPADTTIECDESTAPTNTGNATALDTCDPSPLVTYADVVTPGICPQEEIITRTWTATDECGNSSECTQSINVVDTTPPVIQNVTANPNDLWPPNHKMVQVTVVATATDNCDPTPDCTISNVSSNEPVNGLGDGNTAPDWVITGDLTVDLRAERSGKGDGRIYTIEVTCTDECGNSSTATAGVTVRHDKGK